VHLWIRQNPQVRHPLDFGFLTPPGWNQKNSRATAQAIGSACHGGDMHVPLWQIIPKQQGRVPEHPDSPLPGRQQTPFEQMLEDGQTLPHVPQLLLSPPSQTHPAEGQQSKAGGLSQQDPLQPLTYWQHSPGETQHPPPAGHVAETPKQSVGPLPQTRVVEVVLLLLLVEELVDDDDEVLLEDDEDDEDVVATVVVVVDVVPLTQTDAVPNDDAGGQPDPHAWPAAQQVRFAPLPHGVLPAGQPHLPVLASMQAMPL
jgi:hypothetical protein